MQELVLSYITVVLLTLLLPFAFIIFMGVLLFWEVERKAK
jgi:hypothetical protein